MTGVKMTPLEINKKIAELKCSGFKYQSGNQILINYKEEPARQLAKNLSPVNYIISSRWVNWAEDISDAWELFEEMRKNGNV